MRKIIIIQIIMAASILFGLMPEDPQGWARNLGNLAFWWVSLMGIAALAAGIYLSIKIQNGKWKKEKPQKWTKKQLIRLFLGDVFLAALLAASGHYWLATLWLISGATLVGAKIEHIEKAEEAAAEEDAETRPA